MTLSVCLTCDRCGIQDKGVAYTDSAGRSALLGTLEAKGWRRLRRRRYDQEDLCPSCAKGLKPKGAK